MKKIFKRTTKNDSFDKTEFENEITLAIKAGMANAEADVKDNWSKLFPNGEEPTPEEFIKTLAAEVIKRSFQSAKK